MTAGTRRDRYFTATGYLAADVTDVATSLRITTATGTLPTAPNFYRVLGDSTARYEAVKVTGISGSTYTVTRAQEGTTAVAHPYGESVSFGISDTDIGNLLTQLQLADLVFNVRDAPYGATADGVTDDTTKVQAAIDAANAAGGGVVYFPRGNYKLSAALTVYSKITLRGDGRQVSKLTQTVTNQNGLSGYQLTDFAVEDLGIIGPYSGTGTGITLIRDTSPSVGVQYRTTFDRLLVAGWGGDGVSLQQPIVSTFNNVEAQDITGYGFKLTGIVDQIAAAATSCQLNACYANGIGKAGFYLDNMTYCELSSCATDSAGIGYWVRNSLGIQFSGCGCEFPVNNGAGFEGDCWRIEGSGGITLDSPYPYAIKRYGVYVKSSTLKGASYGVLINGLVELDPQGGATASIRFDSGQSGMITGSDNVATAWSVAGSVTTVSPTYMSAPGDLYAYGNVLIPTAGKGLRVAEGSNAKMGVATLSGGAATVSTTAVTANSRIFLTCQTPGGTPGFLRVSARTAGTSFAITSSSGTDTSVVGWMMVEPA